MYTNKLNSFYELITRRYLNVNDFVTFTDTVNLVVALKTVTCERADCVNALFMFGLIARICQVTLVYIFRAVSSLISWFARACSIYYIALVCIGCYTRALFFTVHTEKPSPAADCEINNSN